MSIIDSLTAFFIVDISHFALANVMPLALLAADTVAPSSGVENFTEAQSVLLDLWHGFLYRLPGLGVGLLIMALFIIAAGPLSRLLLKPFSFSSLTPLIKSVAQRSISLVIILLGVYLFLFMAGLTGFAVAVISGTGVVGLILGFAFRDIAENFISSLLLTIQRPFRIGDIVEINEFTGIIQKVTSRATTMVDFDGNHIQIPNATIYKGVIKNLTANPLMRGHFIVGVGYDADVRNAQNLAVEIISSHAKVLKDPEPQVLIDNLGASTYNLKVYFWVNVEDTSVLKMSSLLMRQIVGRFTEENISMPDDARERVFPDGLAIVSNQSVSKEDSADETSGFTSLNKPFCESKNTELSGNKKPALALAGKPAENTPYSSNFTGSKSQTSTLDNSASSALENENENEDVSSEAEDIREQAKKARDPESGENIL
ncbi:mechanosensitive ion channel family protein [Alteromonas sp. Mac1]|uniref:mechanosensitive ion channel family protein n=1 Tax=Alteromonas sp. Mac1 TaxID=1777491 RepID=UPI0007703729|nr:mechanosensitive ion channel family protein [Alteromonas sp. Mac1]AMJ86463.1 mechanosensitive ion channel protein MscS [Alteromonas sp. Mac1]AMJ90322.1 mechanosensitive ion channel protein MscS [Alteromonas sp. Mac2]